MTQDYLPILLQVIVAVGFAGVALLLSVVLAVSVNATPRRILPTNAA